jgi:ribosomal protein S21
MNTGEKMATDENGSVEKLAGALRSMEGQATKSRTRIGTIRALFSEIEHSQNIGHSLEDILAAMKENGFDKTMPLQTFYNAMTTIRKERGILKTKRTARAALNTAPVTVPEPIPMPAPVPEVKKESVRQDEGIVDVFAKQAEREAKKAAEAKRPKIPRR